MGAHVMLTLVVPYYDNGQMLRAQYANWRTWPSKHRNALKVIIVDDGSPNSPAANVPRPYGLPELEIYRVQEDRPWWQNGARNIGAHEAPEGWMLLTDMDHMLEAEAAGMLFKRLAKLDPQTAYMLDRVEADTGLPTLGRDGNPKPHPNSFVITREMFWRAGGYDERTAGNYGTDRIWRDRLYSFAKHGHLDIPLTRFWRELVSDASTTNLPRKEGRDPNARKRMMEIIAAAPNDRLRLSQAWQRVL
jgi:hypothetical protein